MNAARSRHRLRRNLWLALGAAAIAQLAAAGPWEDFTTGPEVLREYQNHNAAAGAQTPRYSPRLSESERQGLRAGAATPLPGADEQAPAAQGEPSAATRKPRDPGKTR